MMEEHIRASVLDAVVSYLSLGVIYIFISKVESSLEEEEEEKGRTLRLRFFPGP